MELGITEIIVITGIAMALGGGVYASKHDRKFKSKRMIITYLGIVLSGITFALPILQ